MTVPATRVEEPLGRRAPIRRLRLLHIALAYLALAASLRVFAVVEVGPISVHLLVALVVAWIGWHRMTPTPALRRYLPFAAGLGVWIMLSSISVWELPAVYWSATTLVWLLFIIPGIAHLLMAADMRKALLFGFALAAVVYSATVFIRFVSGDSVFDPGYESVDDILGVKRNFVNAQLLFILPVIVWYGAGLPRPARWILATLGLTTIFVSGGRSGVVGLGVIGLTYLVLQPGATRKLRVFLAVLLTSLVILVLIGEFGGQAAVGKNRLVSYIRGERTSSDEHREIQLRRAWHVGLEHPAFGVGYTNLQGRPDPALNEIRKPDFRRKTREGGVHNTYAQVFAEFGVIAAAFLVALTLVLIGEGVRARRHREVRVATCAFIGVVVMMMFHPLSLEMLYYAMAYLVGTLSAYTTRSPPLIAEGSVPSSQVG